MMNKTFWTNIQEALLVVIETTPIITWTTKDSFGCHDIHTFVRDDHYSKVNGFANFHYTMRQFTRETC